MREEDVESVRADHERRGEGEQQDRQQPHPHVPPGGGGRLIRCGSRCRERCSIDGAPRGAYGASAADERHRRRACCRERALDTATPPGRDRARRTASPGFAIRRASTRNSVGVRAARPSWTNTACATGSSFSAPAWIAEIGGGASEQRRQARDQLREGERLRQVVVAPGVEARQPVGKRIPRRQEQHRRPDPLRSDCLADVTSVGIGQPDVDDEHVGGVARQSIEQLSSRPHAPGRETLFAEPADDHRAKLEIILDDQNLRDPAHR